MSFGCAHTRAHATPPPTHSKSKVAEIILEKCILQVEGLFCLPKQFITQDLRKNLYLQQVVVVLFVLFILAGVN